MGFVINTPGAQAAADHLKFTFNRIGQEANRAKILGHLRNLEHDPAKFASQTPVLVNLLVDLRFFQHFKESEHGQKFIQWLSYLRKAWQANPAGALAYPKIGRFLLTKIGEPPYRDIIFDWEEIADRDCPDAALTLDRTGAWLITAYTVPLDKIDRPPGKPMGAGAAAMKLKGRKGLAKKAAKKAVKKVAKKAAKKAVKKAVKKAGKKKGGKKKTAKRHG